MSSRLVYILLFLLPIIILFMLPSGAMMGVMWFWIILLTTMSIMWFFLGPPTHEQPQIASAEPQMIPESEQPAQIRKLMDVRVATEENLSLIHI